MQRRRVHPFDPDLLLAGARPLWPVRKTPEQEALTDFIDSYLSRLRLDQQSIIRSCIFEGRTYEDVGRELGVGRHSVMRRLKTSLRALVRAIALDDPCFQEYEERLVRPRGGQQRDFEAESNAAFDVLQRQRACNQPCDGMCRLGSYCPEHGDKPCGTQPCKDVA